MDRVRYERLTVVLTTRSGKDGVESLVSFVEMLEARGVVVIELGPLNDVDARQLVVAAQPEASEDQVAACLGAGRGNPLVLRHLAESLTEGMDLSDALGSSVRERLGALPDEVADVVKAAAVGGDDVQVEELAVVVGASVAAVVGSLEQARHAGLVRESGDEWRFDHDLIREAVAGSIDEPDRVSLHREWALVLSERGPVSVVSAVDHIMAAGPPFDSWELDVLLSFASGALHRSPDEAGKAFSLVVGHTSADDDRHRVARTGAAEAHLWSSHSGDPAGREDAEVLTRLRHEFRQGRVSRSTIIEAERSVRGTMTGARLDESLARIAMYASASLQPQPRLIMELDERSASLTPLAEVWLRHAQDRLLILSGEFVESMWIGERAKAAGDRLPLAHPARIRAALTFGRLACQTEQRHAEGFEALQWAERQAEAIGSVSSQLDACLDHGMQLKMWDRWDEAETRFGVGAALAQETGAVSAQDHFALQLVELAIARGDISRADDIMAKRFGRPDPVAFWAMQAGHLRLVRGDVGEAIQTLVPLVEGRDVFPEVRRLSLEVLAQAAFVADDDRARAVLRHGCQRLTGDARPARLCRAVVLASVDGDTALADAALAELADAPPYVRGGFGLLAGLAHQRSGNEERAVDCFTLARQLAVDRGAIATVRLADRLLFGLGVHGGEPVLDRPATGWESLTPAEIRVVEVVAEGVVYREIAERLFISRRTVESHVASALRKLGLRNRSQLATAFVAEHGPQAG